MTSAVQNSAPFLAAAPIRRGWPVKLSGSAVVETSSDQDLPIGVALHEAAAGERVEIAQLGWAPVAIAGATGGQLVSLDATGAPSVTGTGAVIGLVTATIGGSLAACALGALGTVPGSGGGGGLPLQPFIVTPAPEEPGYIDVTDELFGQSLLLDPDQSGENMQGWQFGSYADHPKFSEPYGTQTFFQLIAMTGSDPLAIIVDGNPLVPGGVIAVVPSPEEGITSHLGFQCCLTRATASVGPGAFDGWILTASPIALAADIDASDVSYAPAEPGDWISPPTSPSEALDELAARIKALEDAP